MSGNEYPKIQTLYNRDKAKHFVLVDQLRRPEFANIKIWTLTEKIHGRNTRITLFDSGRVDYGGRTDDAAMTPELLEYLKKTFPPEKLMSTFWRPGKMPPKQATMYGEAYGSDMAHGSRIYRKDISFRLFDCLIDIYWLERANLEDIARRLGIKLVPLLGTIDFLPTELSQLDKIFESNKQSLVFSEESDKELVSVKPEGIVARTSPLIYYRDGGKIERLMWKLKVKDFEIKESIKLKWKYDGNDNNINWKLFSGNELIGYIRAVNDKNGLNGWNIVGACGVINYIERWENVYDKDIKIIISNMKKYIVEQFPRFQVEKN